MARIQFYKPNPKGTGSACSFWSSVKDGSLFGSFIKQSSWNDKTKTGSFKANKENPAASTQFKFNRNEVAAILDCIESDREFSAYHSTPKQITRFKFTPYSNAKGRVGFSYSVNKEDKEDSTNKAGFIIGLTFAEARHLKEYFIYTLASMFKWEDEQAAANESSPDSGTEKKPQNKKETPSVKAPDISDVLEDDENW
jgi:hypothetical protein